MNSTMHRVEFPYTRQELEALFRFAHEHYEIETDEGFSLEDLLQELGRLERQALGVVKHGDMTPRRPSP